MTDPIEGESRADKTVYDAAYDVLPRVSAHIEELRELGLCTYEFEELDEVADKVNAAIANMMMKASEMYGNQSVAVTSDTTRNLENIFAGLNKLH